jgi:hypothetical protein
VKRNPGDLLSFSRLFLVGLDSIILLFHFEFRLAPYWISRLFLAGLVSIILPFRFGFRLAPYRHCNEIGSDSIMLLFRPSGRPPLAAFLAFIYPGSNLAPLWHYDSIARRLALSTGAGA